jgi:hypothetical protein
MKLQGQILDEMFKLSQTVQSSSPESEIWTFSDRSFPSCMKFGINISLHLSKSRDSSVGIALGYELGDRGSSVRFPAGAGNFSLHHRVQTGSEAHPAFYPMVTRGSFPGGKAAGA